MLGLYPPPGTGHAQCVPHTGVSRKNWWAPPRPWPQPAQARHSKSRTIAAAPATWNPLLGTALRLQCTSLRSNLEQSFGGQTHQCTLPVALHQKEANKAGTSTLVARGHQVETGEVEAHC